MDDYQEVMIAQIKQLVRAADALERIAIVLENALNPSSKQVADFIEAVGNEMKAKGIQF